MSDAATYNEFPFVEQLPKREKSKLRKLWDVIGEMSDLVEKEGMMIPAPMAAKALGISRQRLHVLVQERRLQVILFHGHHYITEKALVEFAKEERKTGRPINPPEKFKDCVRAAFDYAKEVRQEAREKQAQNKR